MRKLAHFFSLIVTYVFRFLPWFFNLVFAKIFAFLWLDVFGIRKKVVFDNLEIAFPKMPQEQKNKLMRKSLVALARSFFDVMRIPSLTDEWIQKNVMIHGREHIDAQKAYLFLSLHIGSGDLGAAIMSREVKPLSLISKRFKNEFLDEFWFSFRTQSATQFIDAHGKNNAFDILKALKNKRGVVFVLDQFMGKPYGIRSEFFGRTTGTAYGLALFAQKTKAPVVPLYNYWDTHNKLHICIGSPVDLSDLVSVEKLSENEQEALNRKITNRFNQVLETIIQKYPDQWMWVHRRWKDFE